MKKLNRLALTASMLSVLLCVSGCDLRMDKGEDLHAASKTEVRVIKDSLVYFVDEYGNCFATLKNHTDGYRSTFTLSSIDCNKMP